MAPFPTDRHGLIHRAAVLAAQFSDDDYRHSLRQKETVSIARGVCVPAATRTPSEWHRLKAIAAAVTSEVTPVLSHQSAATVHGLEMLKPNLRRVHMTTGNPDGGYRTATQHRHVGTLNDVHIVEVDGIRVTSIDRTAVDVACTSSMGFAGALAIFDSAIRNGADGEVMAGMLRGKRRGAQHARRALHHADGLSENPGESWGRVQMIEAGLPIPRLQHEVVDEDGTLIARTDYDWAGLLVGSDGASRRRPARTEPTRATKTARARPPKRQTPAFASCFFLSSSAMSISWSSCPPTSLRLPASSRISAAETL